MYTPSPEAVLAWAEAAKREAAHTIAAGWAIGRGGADALDTRDWQAIDQAADAQAQHIDATAQAINAGALPHTRALLASSNATRHAWAAQNESHTDHIRTNNLYNEERRRANNGACPDCQDAEALGWRPVGTTPPIGSTQCLHNCRCTKEYRKA